jgi:hypothetical protein
MRKESGGVEVSNKRTGIPCRREGQRSRGPMEKPDEGMEVSSRDEYDVRGTVRKKCGIRFIGLLERGMSY